jgi:hypothetical protein
MSDREASSKRLELPPLELKFGDVILENNSRHTRRLVVQMQTSWVETIKLKTMSDGSEIIDGIQPASNHRKDILEVVEHWDFPKVREAYRRGLEEMKLSPEQIDEILKILGKQFSQDSVVLTTT